jgi:hypothetical protein
MAVQLPGYSATLIFFAANLLGAPAVLALPFNANSTDFENFVNQVWRGGGAAGVNVGPSMKSDDPPRESRRYWGFHDCIWKTDDDAINGKGNVREAIGVTWGSGNTYEVFQCSGYLDYKTPMKSDRCKGRFSYEWRRKDGVWGKYIEQDLNMSYGICT